MVGIVALSHNKKILDKRIKELKQKIAHEEKYRAHYRLCALESASQKDKKYYSARADECKKSIQQFEYAVVQIDNLYYSLTYSWRK